MIFNSIPWFLVAGFFMCCGCAVAAIVLDRKYRDDRRNDEQAMTKRLKDRVAEYEQLEEQIKTVKDSFEAHERAYQERLEVQKQNIDQLQAALDARAGHAPRAEATTEVRDAEPAATWMDGIDEESIEVIVDESGAHSVAEMQRKLDHAHAEQTVVLERELQSLSDTQMRIAALQPLQELVRQRDAELEVLREELRNAKLGTTGRHAKSPESLAPLVEELAKTQDVVREWQAKTDELATTKATEIGALNDRLRTLEPLVQQANDARRDAETWRAEYTALEQRAAQTEVKYCDEVQRLRGDLADFEGRFAKVHSDLEAAKTNGHALQARSDELGRNLDCAQLELDQTREAREVAERKNGELTADVESLTGRCDGQARELESLRASYEELSRTTNRQSEMVTMLESRAKELDAALAEKAQRLAMAEERAHDQAQRGERLTTELETARREHLEVRHAAEARTAALQAELAGLNGTCSSLRASVTEWTERCKGHERAIEVKARDLTDREQRLSEVSARVEVLNLEIAREREALTERDRKLQDVGAKLERVEGQVQKYRAAMSAHAQQFEVAQTLLAELKPVIENLGNELTHDKVGRD
ncbi:MAG: hypothetical protein K8S98_08185 [Planctomycetes bacterium]|nr:hypothetical protein [Planctomycetota bacterium]